MLTIDLITRNYGSDINGLSRYDREIQRYFQARPDLTLNIHPLRIHQNWPLRAIQRLSGLDLAAFLGVYPLRLPSRSGDVLHLTTSSHASALLMRPPQPVVVTVHDIIHFAQRHDQRLSTYRHVVQRLADKMAVRNLRRASAVIASSEFTRQQLIDLIGIQAHAISVIPLGIDTTCFRPLKVPESFLARYGLDPDTPYILHVSSEEPRKNIETLLRAWQHVRVQYPHAVLLKVGTCLYPEERARSVNLIGALGITDSVRFISGVSDSDLALFYSGSRAFAFPSLAEGFGFPVLEAMACGTVVVCSTAPALTELVGGVALQHSPLDVETLAAQLAQALGNELDRETLCRRGVERAAHFDWRSVGQQTLAVYENLVAQAA